MRKVRPIHYAELCNKIHGVDADPLVANFKCGQSCAKLGTEDGLVTGASCNARSTASTRLPICTRHPLAIASHARMTTMLTFGQTIRQLRTARQLTQRALAKEVGINFTYLSKIENNRLEPGQSPKKETIARLAEALDTDSDNLLLLARKIPDSISERIMERPALFRRIACLDNETVERLLDGLADHKKEETLEVLDQSQDFLHKTLDSLSQHIAVIDEQGRILAANRAWRDFATSNGLDVQACGPGADYLSICEAAMGLGADGAQEIAEAIRQILIGERDSYETEYPCHSPSERRWFLLRITRFDQGNTARAVVSHDRITARHRVDLEGPGNSAERN